MTKHNKKRNVGLIHEQLIRYVASSLIARDKKSAEKAIAIITKHFKQDSELFREFRLFNALLNLPVGSRSLAERILLESKKSAITHSSQKLRKEKSNLIKDINHGLSQSARFYDIKIESYRLYATVQTMLNEWRGMDSLSLTNKAKYEEQIVEHLARTSTAVLKETFEADPLVRKLMFQKFEEKYKEHLSTQQQAVLESAILGDENNFSTIICEIKKKALITVNEFKKTCDNNVLLEKIDNVKTRIERLSEAKSDDTVAKTLHLVHLLEEMEIKNEQK